jgi:hypothetical protein
VRGAIRGQASAPVTRTRPVMVLPMATGATHAKPAGVTLPSRTRLDVLEILTTGDPVKKDQPDCICSRVRRRARSAVVAATALLLALTAFVHEVSNLVH